MSEEAKQAFFAEHPELIEAEPDDEQAEGFKWIGVMCRGPGTHAAHGRVHALLSAAARQLDATAVVQAGDRMTPERRDAAVRHFESYRSQRLYRLDHARKMDEMFPGGSHDEVVYAAQEIDAIDDALEALKALGGKSE